MTLTHLFKAQAIFAWLWAVMFWLAPEMAASGPGWEVTPNAIAFGQVVSVPMLALGIISWNAPAWVGDNLKKVGMILGKGGVNIAEYLLSRTPNNDSAYSVIKFDGQINEELLEELTQVEEISDIKQLHV